MNITKEKVLFLVPTVLIVFIMIRRIIIYYHPITIPTMINDSIAIGGMIAVTIFLICIILVLIKIR